MRYRECQCGELVEERFTTCPACGSDVSARRLVKDKPAEQEPWEPWAEQEADRELHREPPDWRSGLTIDDDRRQEPFDERRFEGDLRSAEAGSLECKHHPGVAAVDRCAGCSEGFCSDCLVEIQGKAYCGDCKIMTLRGGAPPILEERTEPCKEANQALILAIVGIFCFGIILGPVAISKALKAKRQIEEDPRLTGAGKATAALTIGSIVVALWVLGLLSRLAQA